MSARVRLSILVGAVFGLSGAVVGFVVGGLPGEVAGVFLAMPASALFGVWNGTRR